MRYIILYIAFLMMVFADVCGQRISYSFYGEAGPITFGAGANLHLVRDSNYALTAGFIYTREYGSSDITGENSVAPSNPYLQWQHKGVIAEKRSYPGVSLGLVLARIIMVHAYVDWSSYKTYNIWYSGTARKTYNTVKTEESKTGFGGGISIKMSGRVFFGLTYHREKGFGLRLSVVGD